MEKSCTRYSPEEALCLLVETKSIKCSYNVLSKSSTDRNANIYPSYMKRVAAKELCYPENIRCTESDSEVPLQNLLNHTIKGILQTLKALISNNFMF